MQEFTNTYQISNKNILKSEYNIILKIGYVISLSVIILLFQFFPQYLKNHLNYDSHSDYLEVISIPLFDTVKEPPPQVVQPQIDKSEIIEPEKNAVVIEKKEDFRVEVKDDNLKLDITSNLANNLMSSNSNLLDLSKIQFKTRNRENLHIDNSSLYAENTARSNISKVNFEIESTKKTIKKVNIAKINPQNTFLTATKQQQESVNETNKSQDANRIELISGDQFLIKESESTIGTSEYKTWNRIKAVLDRLDKDRFGDLPDNVKRNSNGLTITFSYDNGIQHDIYWTKGGHAVIRVTGSRPQFHSDELLRAYQSLFKLTYKIDS